MKAAAIIAALLLTGCSGAVRPMATAAQPPFRSRPVPRTADRLQADIAALVNAPDLQRGVWGVLVRSLDTGATLCSLNAGTLLLPASNMKIPTLAAAAARLGWDFAYQTEVRAVGAVDAGFLNGDLVVVGSGDPTIDDWDGAATRLFAAWGERLKEAGIRTVGGRIIADDNAFDDEPLGAGWAWDDLGASFATGVGALQFNQNTARLAITAATAPGGRVSVVVVPDGSGLVLDNLLTTGVRGSAPSVAIRRLPGRNILQLRGSVPAGFPLFYRNVSVDNPTMYFATRLRDALIASGIEVRGDAVDIDVVADPPGPQQGVPLVIHRSAPLRALSETMMKLSQNLYAETLLRTLGGPSDVDTIEAGRAAVRSVLEEWGIEPEDAIVADGSGLSRYNLMTPSALVSVLTRVYDDPDLREPFVAALPLAGSEGTLAGRMKGTAAGGNARAKSGALSNARSLSGYVRTADGEPLVFAIIANNFGLPGDRIEAVQDRIVVALASFSRR